MRMGSPAIHVNANKPRKFPTVVELKYQNQWNAKTEGV